MRPGIAHRYPILYLLVMRMPQWPCACEGVVVFPLSKEAPS